MKSCIINLILFLFFVPSLASGQEHTDFYEHLLGIQDTTINTNAGSSTLPILSLPSNTEQQGLANASTAVALDSGFFEANPAASALVENNEIGLYYSNIIADVNLQALNFVYRINDLGLGSLVKILHTPFTAYEIQGEQIASSYYIESVLGINASYAFFRDYYFSGLAVGANVKLAHRSIPSELYQHLGSINQEQSALGILFDLGLLVRFNFLKSFTSRERNFSIGASLHNIGPLIMDDSPPTQFNFGIAWAPVRFWMVTGDFILPISLIDPQLALYPGFSVGTSVIFSPLVTVRSGFMLKGGNPRFSIGSDIQFDGFRLSLSYTLDFTTQFRLPDHIGIQLDFDMGDDGRAALQAQVDALYIDALTALSDSDYQKVIILCTAALNLDAGFTPAKETLALARKSQELIDKIEPIRLDEAKIDE